MARPLKLHAIAVAAFACAFYWAFMFAKHDPTLRNIIPFGADPYDAVGSFAVIVAPLVAILGLWRAFRPYRGVAPSPVRVAYLVRTLFTVLIAAALTVVSNAISMMRHVAQWDAASGRGKLLALEGGTLLVSLLLGTLVRRSGKSGEREAWVRAGLASVVAATVLAIYPGALIKGTGAHLATVVLGALLLFVPLRFLLSALVRVPTSEHVTLRQAGHIHLRPRLHWLTVVGLGFVVGLYAFVGEMSEGGGRARLAQALPVAAVFTGLGTIGVVIAYALLGRPLGLGEA